MLTWTARAEGAEKIFKQLKACLRVLRELRGKPDFLQIKSGSNEKGPDIVPGLEQRQKILSNRLEEIEEVPEPAALIESHHLFC